MDEGSLKLPDEPASLKTLGFVNASSAPRQLYMDDTFVVMPEPGSGQSAGAIANLVGAMRNLKQVRWSFMALSYESVTSYSGVTIRNESIGYLFFFRALTRPSIDLIVPKRSVPRGIRCLILVDAIHAESFVRASSKKLREFRDNLVVGFAFRLA